MSTVPKLDAVLVGPVPPPRGGVSSHVERLVLLLEGEGIRVGVLNHGSDARDPRVIASLHRNAARYWLQLRRLQAPLVHYHHSRLDTLLATALARRSWRSTWIVTFHSDVIERSLTSKVPGVALLSRWAITRFDRIIAVSEPLANLLRTETSRPVTIIPAYLPLPEPAQDNCGVDSVSPTAIVAASRVASRVSKDRYGLDVASAIFLAASDEIADLRFDLYLTQAPTGMRTRRYLAQVLRPLRDAGLESRLSVKFGSELFPALRWGAVYLRTTRTDGDAVSIREALDAGVPVLASDVVERPAGTIELPLDDIAAWVKALSRAVERSRSMPPISKISNEQAEAMVVLYRDEISRWAEPHTA